MKTIPRWRLIALMTTVAIPLIFLISVPAWVSAHTGSSTPHAAPKVSRVAGPADTAVLTYKNDTLHSGLNSHETILTPNTVNPSQFGRRVSYHVDGQLYAQPLYMPGLTIGGNVYNVVFAATERDTLYAFDADQTNSAAPPLWKASFLGSGEVPVSTTDVNCNNIQPVIGISGTPVIDPNTNTLYAVGFSKQSNGTLVYRLHAINIITGLEMPGSPIKITGIPSFANNHERQRANLLLANGKIYMAFASFCDLTPYHGFVLSYTYNGSAFALANVYNDTPNGGLGGIWGGAGTLTADPSGNIYVMTGNGTFDLNTGGQDASDSFVKLDANLKRADYFTPFNQSCLEAADGDLGSGGPLILSGNGYTELIGAGKEGRIYVINANSMGHFHSIANPCTTTNQAGSNDPNIKQELPQHYIGGVFSTPTTWSSATTQYVYFSGDKDHVKAFRVNSDGTLVTPPASQTAETFNGLGPNTFISSNGNTNGILWVIDPSSTTPVLRAYDATNLSHELYSGALSSGHVKFVDPMVANGEVFAGTQSALDIFGVLPTSPEGYNNTGISTDSSPAGANFDGNGYSYSAQALSAAGITPGGAVNFNGVSFTWPSAPAGTLDNYQADGQTIALASGSNENAVAFLGSATNGNTSAQGTITFTDNTTQPFTLNFSDWTLGGNKNPVAFGNGVVAISAYRNTATGQQTRKAYVFYTQVAFDSGNAGKTVMSVTLPNPTTGALHVFALVATNTTTPPPPPVSYNNTGICNDGNSASANFDGGGYSYSAQALSTAGVTPNSQFNFGGYAFTWPNVPAGSADNYQANGQVIPVTPVASATALGFLGSSTHGPTSVMVTITYADNTTQTFPLTFSDWTLNAGTSSPATGNQIAITTPYRNGPAGMQTKNTYIFFAEVALTDVASTVTSITLSSPTGTGALHVFAFATK